MKFTPAMLLGLPFWLGPVMCALASEANISLPPGQGLTFPEQSGEGLYRALCRACHMENGQGATGAGTYPSLRANPKMAAAGYPVALVLNGQKAMPSLGDYLSNEQVAAVVGYVRTHFDHYYTEAVTSTDVEKMRSSFLSQRK